MQLNELDKKSLIELKDEIADLEARVKELSAIRAKHDVPLEVLLECTSFKEVRDNTFDEGRAQAMEFLGPNLDEERFTYSPLLESGKKYYVQPRGVIGIFALKIFDGEGLFEFIGHGAKMPYFTFTAIPGEKYVLPFRGLILLDDSIFEVKELEGHIRYVLAMSTFGKAEIKEVL
jgi:hypothetical protein